MSGTLEPFPGGNQESRVLWSEKPRGVAVVLVHGFNGDPLKTWKGFPRLFRSHAVLAETDAFFYGYDSLSTQIAVSALDLQHFVAGLLADPTPQFQATSAASRPSDFRYKRIVIVAHSLGSVIARKALIRAHENKEPWINSTRLVLFAPAHKGAIVTGALREAKGMLGALGSALGAVIGSQVVTINELQEGSPTLQLLQQSMQDALELGASSDSLRAAHVVWARRDKVVRNEHFPGDPDPVPIERSHTAICKPESGYPDPRQFVESVLR